MSSNTQDLSTAEPLALTRERILDAAELLFAERGLEAVSVRDITTAANANVGAINYHFGSKQGLVLEVFNRRLRPLDQQRFAALERLEQEYGDAPIPLEALVKALVQPVVELAFNEASGSIHFTRLIGRALGEAGETIEKLRQERFFPLLTRFESAFARALPGLSREELFWRIIFMFGALHYMLLSLHQPPRGWPISKANAEVQVQRIVGFATAGLRTREGRNP